MISLDKQFDAERRQHGDAAAATNRTETSSRSRFNGSQGSMC